MRFLALVLIGATFGLVGCVGWSIASGDLNLLEQATVAGFFTTAAGMWLVVACRPDPWEEFDR